MKAWIIGKLRKRIKSDGYVLKRMEKYALECKYWNDFLLFDCNTLYVGAEMKYFNMLKYEKYGKRSIRKFYRYKEMYESKNQ